ncbi:hypothetical protein MUP77_02120 [Candidatus Bathyarchaeota archaeon]|nr:hypothetical protein [Candidatus Bathyarchaeota archaeon]
MTTRDVLKIVSNIAQSLKHSELRLNERYLHHFFSHVLQENYNILDLTSDTGLITLHPEWPTYKKQTRLFFGRYKEENGKYKVDANGKAGFIDFAIGDYMEPNIGIEFSLKYSWSNEDIIYDFLKLLDKKNPFRTSISFNVLFRKEGLSKGKHLANLEEHINGAFREAVNRLNGETCNTSRELYFIVTEIDKKNNRRHWHYDRESSEFRIGLPVAA